MKIKRRQSRVIRIGSLKIGGNHPVAVQSMAKTFTSDLSATVREVKELQSAGCQLVRVAVRDKRDAANLKRIKQRIDIPLVADIHFDASLAIQAIENGVDKIRLNPGNINKPELVRGIARAARQARIPIRVGVNSGSVMNYPRITGSYRKNPAQSMVKCALDYIKLLEGEGFKQIVVSLKGSDIFTTIQANQIIATVCDYPLHLGVTATGTSLSGIVKSAMVIGRLLCEGIGDTIRISLTERSVCEVKAGFYILQALGMGNCFAEIISCPTCGRCQVDLLSIVQELEKKISTGIVRPFNHPLKVAVMGCVVNGPGEAKQADLGVAFGKDEGLLFKKGKPIRKISLQRCVKALLGELKVMS